MKNYTVAISVDGVPATGWNGRAESADAALQNALDALPAGTDMARVKSTVRISV